MKITRFLLCFLLAIGLSKSQEVHSINLKTIDDYNGLAHIGLWELLSQQNTLSTLQDSAYLITALSFLSTDTLLSYTINKINKKEILKNQKIYDQIKILEYIFLTTTNMHLHTIKEIAKQQEKPILNKIETNNPSSIKLENVIQSTQQFPNLQQIILAQLRIWQQTEFMIMTHNYAFLDRLYEKSINNIKKFTYEYHASLNHIEELIKAMNQNLYNTIDIEDL